jgi:F-type H+-transporting ATPase subunit b
MVLSGDNLLSQGLAALTGGEAVTVDLDKSVFIQIGLFVLLMLVLKPTLFDPMLKLFAEREAKIDKVRKEATTIDKKSANALATYEAEMAKARGAANAEREKIRAEGQKQEQEILDRVRKAAAAKLEEGKRESQAEAARVRAELKTASTDLGRDLAARVLGREVSS